MKCLEQRPAATISSKLVVERVEGGWVIRVSSMTKGNKFYDSHKIIAKSLNEVLILVKEWSSPWISEKGEEKDEE